MTFTAQKTCSLLMWFMPLDLNCLYVDAANISRYKRLSWCFLGEGVESGAVGADSTALKLSQVE